MANKGWDWMPSTIQGRIDMGRRWVDILKVKGTGWRVPEIVTGDLEEFVEAAEEAQAQVLSGGATEALRHRRDRFVAEMVAYMRDVRNRYFFIPPMNEEDFLSLGLRLPDTVRTQHTLKFDETDRGKTVYIALQWQNERGITGQWSDIKSTVIP
jgi:hypothetical protein